MQVDHRRVARAPGVSVIIPCFNEANHIDGLLRCIMNQKPVSGGMEVIIADGMSCDGTRDVLGRYASRGMELRVIDNPERFVSSGLNRAISVARGAIVVRMDVHTKYASDYVWQCVRVLEATGGDNVGGPWRAVGKTYFERAIATAFESPFSSGGAASHRPAYEGPVDSVYLGCWRRATLEKIGGFDEELVRNQDDELNLRIIRAGGTVWQDPAIVSWYSPRSSLLALFKQYAQYGYWKVRVIQKHGRPASMRHLAPAVFVAIAVTLGLLVPVHRYVVIALIALVGTYFAAALFETLRLCAAPKRWSLIPVMPLVFGTFHMGYGYGFLYGILYFRIRRKDGPMTFSRATR